MTSLTDNSLVMTSGQNATVTLKFYGRRSDLNNLTSESLTVTADVSRIKSEGEQNLRYTVTLPDSVSDNNVQLTERTPSRLDGRTSSAPWKSKLTSRLTFPTKSLTVTSPIWRR